MVHSTVLLDWSRTTDALYSTNRPTICYKYYDKKGMGSEWSESDGIIKSVSWVCEGLGVDTASAQAAPCTFLFDGFTHYATVCSAAVRVQSDEANVPSCWVHSGGPV